MAGTASGWHRQASSRRTWGWHSLDDSWAARIVAQSGVGSSDLVVDLGAGTGALTRPLVGTGAKVVAVELHSGRAAALRSSCRDRSAAGRLVVLTGDILEVSLPRRPFVVVANPPYAVGAAVVRRLLAPGSKLSSAYVVLPLAVARRLAAYDAPGGPRWERSYRLEVGLRLPRSAFRPRPRLDSALLVVSRRR